MPYHSEGSERADEGLGETPALWAGVLAHLQHSYKTSKPWIVIHQPARDSQRQRETGEKKESKSERVNIWSVMNLSWPFFFTVLSDPFTALSLSTHHEPVDMLTIHYRQHKPCGLHSFTDTKQMLHTQTLPLQSPEKWRHCDPLLIRFIVLYMGCSHYATQSVTYVPCYFKWET